MIRKDLNKEVADYKENIQKVEDKISNDEKAKVEKQSEYEKSISSREFGFYLLTHEKNFNFSRPCLSVVCVWQ